MATILQKIKSLALVFAIVACACSCRTIEIDGPGYNGYSPYEYVTIMVTIENKSNHDISLIDISHELTSISTIELLNGTTTSYDHSNGRIVSLHIPQNGSVKYVTYVFIDEINEFCSQIFREESSIVYDSTISISPRNKTTGEFIQHSILNIKSFSNERYEGYVYTFTDEDYDYAVANGVVLGDSAQ